MKTIKSAFFNLFLLFSLSLFLFSGFGLNANAKFKKEINTKISQRITAKGEYMNWEGVSNVSQFTDAEGNYCFAYEKGKKIVICKTKDGKVKQKKKIKKPYPIFGAVTCDSEGYIYVVTGRKGNQNNKDMETVFITKYTSDYQMIQTVGDNGSYGLAYYYDKGFYTKEPFHAGNCDVVVNGNYVAVNYARSMYNGHQSNTALIIDRTTMLKLNVGGYYNSHSFAQRAITYKDGFMLASEGDAYDRAFTVSLVTPHKVEEGSVYDETSQWYHYSENEKKDFDLKEYNIFHFWLTNDRMKNASMFVVNNNYAHMGGIALADDTHAALVGTSVKALTKKASKQKEGLFIQIFNPQMDLNLPEAYYTGETRSGKSGISGIDDVTDYGIKWLTKGNGKIKNPQVIADDKGRFVVLFEKTNGYSSLGVYYTIIDQSGNTVKKISKFDANARLNPYEMPKRKGNVIYWNGNNGGSDALFVYRLKIR